MTFWQLIKDNITKILGAISTVLMTLMSLIASGQMEGLMDESSIRWLAIFGTLIGAAITGVGFNNSAKIKMAEAMETAINATPKQGGFARAWMLAVLLALGAVTTVSMTGCTHTQQAIRNADTPSDYALVFLEGYDGALKTANQWKESGVLSGSNLERVRQAELKAWPLVQKIDPLRQAYERTRSAEDAAALQLAIDAAIREAADFIRIVRELRG